MRILAIKFRALGDTVLWTSALGGLRRMYPEARIDVLGLDSSRPLLDPHPDVDRFIGVSRRDGWPMVQALLRLRRERYDLALAFHANTSLCRWLFLVNAKEKLAHHHSWKFTPRCSDRKLRRPGELLDAIERDYEILRALGWQGAPLPTRLLVEPEESAEAESRLKSLGLSGARPRLLLLPGASENLKRYPRDLWEPVVQALKSDGQFDLAMVSDATLSREWELPDWCRRFGLSLVNDLNLRQLMALISRAQVAVGSDSGPGHIAVAAGLKTVHIFGRGCIGDFHPYDQQVHRALRVVVDCRKQGPQNLEEFRFCTVRECSHLSCLRHITPDEVVRAALSL